MHIDIDIPEDIASQIEAKWDNLSRRVLEAIAIEAYRSEVITSAEVGRMLKLSSRFEVDAFLKQAGAYLHYTEDDLEQDKQTLRDLRAE